MELSNHAQLLALLYSIGFGAALGLLYSFFSVMRLTLGGRAGTSAVLDALYWLIAVTGAFGFVFMVNKGEIRGFILVGMAVGAAVYYVLFGRVMVKVAGAVINFLKKILKKTAAAIKMPFSALGRMAKPWLKLAGRPKKFNKIYKKHFKLNKKQCIIKNIGNKKEPKDSKSVTECMEQKKPQRGKRVE